MDSSCTRKVEKYLVMVFKNFSQIQEKNKRTRPSDCYIRLLNGTLCEDLSRRHSGRTKPTRRDMEKTTAMSEDMMNKIPGDRVLSPSRWRESRPKFSLYTKTA